MPDHYRVTYWVVCLACGKAKFLHTVWGHGDCIAPYGWVDMATPEGTTP